MTPRTANDPSDPGPSVDVDPVDEHHFKEIEATMLYIEEARWRADKAAAALRRQGADSHLVGAVETAREELSDTHRRLMQGTLFAVPAVQASL